MERLERVIEMLDPVEDFNFRHFRMRPLAAAIVAGQRGPLRGGWQSLVDLELGFPGGNLLMFLARVARPLLAPFAIRTTPLPTRTRVFLVTALVGVGAAIGSSIYRQVRASRPGDVVIAREVRLRRLR
jgi:hypothetical protein